jgi:NAD(P)-dependent dehydrogenase (short-subunit alcohol dehydrogenase family)
MISLEGKVALITGAAGGIGAATARLLSTAGAAVVISDVNIDGANSVADEIRSAGGTAEAIRTDISSEAEVKEMIEKVDRTFGRLDILDNNAAILGPALGADLGVMSMDMEVWDRAYAVNCRGTMLVTKHSLPLMIRGGGGSIINLGSMSGVVPLSRVFTYSATKAAVHNLSKNLAREWATQKVRVNTLVPGFFPAEQNRKLLFNEDGSPTARAASILGHTPMARFGKAEELNGAVIFLASRAASGFVTGIDLKVDGGFLCQTI